MLDILEAERKAHTYFLTRNEGWGAWTEMESEKSKESNVFLILNNWLNCDSTNQESRSPSNLRKIKFSWLQEIQREIS